MAIVWQFINAALLQIHSHTPPCHSVIGALLSLLGRTQRYARPGRHPWWVPDSCLSVCERSHAYIIRMALFCMLMWITAALNFRWQKCIAVSEKKNHSEQIIVFVLNFF